MFILKKVITPFLLPPGLFITVLFFFGVWALRRKNGFAAAISFFFAVLIWAFSLTPVSDFLRNGLESGLTLEVDQGADVILVLGGGVHSRVPDLTGKDAPARDTITRLVAAARLYRRLGVPIVISGGRVYEDSVPIATIGKRILKDLGVPSDMLIAEDRSRDTYENATYFKAICSQRGYKRPLMITSGYHIKRALFCFQNVGLDVTAVPSELSLGPEKLYSWRSFLPSSGSLQETSESLHEWLGLIYSRLSY